MKITRDEIATAATKAVTEAKENGTGLYFGSGFEAGVKYAESKSQESDSLPLVIKTVMTKKQIKEILKLFSVIKSVCDCDKPKPMARNLDETITCITCRKVIEQTVL